MNSTDTLTRLRIINKAVDLILHHDSSNISMQELAHALHVDRYFIQEYFDSMDSLLNELVSDILQMTQDTMTTFVKDEMEPLVLHGEMSFHPDHIFFLRDEIACRLGNRFIVYIEAILDYLMIHRNAFQIMIRESLSQGKRKGCIMRFCNLFLPTQDNPVFVATQLNGCDMRDECRFDYLENNIFPLINYVLLHNAFNESFALSDEAMSTRLLNQIRKSNQTRIQGQRYMFSDN